MLLDTTYNVSTPEGVELRLPVAGLASRALAWLIDALIKIIGLTIAGIVLAYLGSAGDGAYLILLFLALWFYNVLFEVFAHGSTPGKKAVGLRVVSVKGTPVGWSESLIRNLIRIIDVLPGSYAFGCASLMLSGNFQRLGDLAAGTIVIYEPKKQRKTSIADVEAEPLQIPITLAEQQAIVTFGERATQLSHDRADELARILQPVLDDVDAVKLSGHANWLVGGGRMR